MCAGALLIMYVWLRCSRNYLVQLIIFNLGSTHNCLKRVRLPATGHHKMSKPVNPGRAAWPAAFEPEIYWWDCQFLITRCFHTCPGKSVFPRSPRLPARCTRKERDRCGGCCVVQWRSGISFSLSGRDVYLTHFFPLYHSGISRRTQIRQASRSPCWSGEGEEAAAQTERAPLQMCNIASSLP